MAKKPTDIELALARSLFWNDKADPGRTRKEALVWDSLRTTYIAAARRLLRAFDRDGLALMMEASAAYD